MHRDNDLQFLLSSVAQNHAPRVGENALAHVAMGAGAAQPRRETAVASHHSGEPDTEARLACAEDILASMEARRKHMELRLDEVFEDVAYAAGGVNNLPLRQWQPGEDSREPLRRGFPRRADRARAKGVITSG
jgi:hypothetical protein